jgi:hypothetical protein
MFYTTLISNKGYHEQPWKHSSFIDNIFNIYLHNPFEFLLFFEQRMSFKISSSDNVVKILKNISNDTLIHSKNRLPINKNAQRMITLGVDFILSLYSVKAPK